MKTKTLLFLTICSATVFMSWKTTAPRWHEHPRKNYTLYYTDSDQNKIKEYQRLIDNGTKTVHHFFQAPYSKPFNVYIHPHRHSLDSTWQNDWGVPDFKSECWMVASGIGSKIDILAPRCWEKEACEHQYSETKKTQQLITHELVHVYHGQCNASPDFSAVEGIDWFVEGLATFVSGQCDAERMAAVKKAIAEKKAPESLDLFWSGENKYGLSGSMVMYIDHKYGRAKLIALLPLTRKTDVLASLKTTEAELLAGWKTYVQNMNEQ